MTDDEVDVAIIAVCGEDNLPSTTVRAFMPLRAIYRAAYVAGMRAAVEVLENSLGDRWDAAQAIDSAANRLRDET